MLISGYPGLTLNKNDEFVNDKCENASAEAQSRWYRESVTIGKGVACSERKGINFGSSHRLYVCTSHISNKGVS